MEKSVDLPAPFGPTSPMRSPRLTCNEASSNSIRAAESLADFRNRQHIELRSVLLIEGGDKVEITTNCTKKTRKTRTSEKPVSSN